MKPVAIFRFSAEDGPGYFASFLDRHSVPWTLFKLDEGATVPLDPENYAGFVFMGGPMSANDDLPWIAPIVKLIRKAVVEGQPCLGHCLGGQIMAKALGGEVTRNAVKEIGWNPVRVVNSPAARAWLGTDAQGFTTFQWHGETFSIPTGAERILTSDACTNQAFVIGKSLAMQCHTEMTPAMIEDWCKDWASEGVTVSRSVQSVEIMMHEIEENIVELRALANRLYGQWIAGLPQS